MVYHLLFFDALLLAAGTTYLLAGASSFLLLLLIPFGQVYRAYKKQRPMGKRTLKRLSRCAPQVLRRAAQRQDGLQRGFRRVLRQMCALDARLLPYRAEVALFGGLVAMHKDAPFIGVAFACIGLDIHCSSMLACRAASAGVFFLLSLIHISEPTRPY